MQPLLIDTNHSTQTATIAIPGARYTYYFLTGAHIHTLEYLFQKVSPLKGLNYAKGHCERWEKQTSECIAKGSEGCKQETFWDFTMNIGR